MNRIKLLGVAALSMGFILGCENMPWNKKKDEHKSATQGAVAMATIQRAGAASTQPSMGNAGGTVMFTQTGDKVRVQANLTGLPPGQHGFHIHEKADLSAGDLTSAGGHYNPQHKHHDGPMGPDRHAGDLGNITADSKGNATLDVTVGEISVGGENNIVGRSIIVHAKADDMKTDPAGNSGARIGGGVIEMKK